jgi:hypothetical protein
MKLDEKSVRRDGGRNWSYDGCDGKTSEEENPWRHSQQRRLNHVDVGGIHTVRKTLQVGPRTNTMRGNAFERTYGTV